jgi:glucose/arabinose dehydrogenase
MKPLLSLSTSSALALCAALAVTDLQAQAWTSAYTSPTATGNCAGLPAALNSADFVIEPIISRTIFTNPQPARITKLAFWLNPTTQKADIFVGERGRSATPSPSPARISYYNASATPPTLTVIGSFTQAYTGFNESGVYGLAVNPLTFDQDNFLYVLYASGTGSSASATNGWRVSRFKLAPTTRMMDMASEKILLHIPAGNANRWHTGTTMRFDNFGNLYIGTGDNEATAMGPANTADFRGGILRIKPDSTNPRGYTVPAGNFGEYWAQKWQDSGLTARAAAYRDTTIVKSELYVKGSRNPYVFGVDPNRLGWVAWSECGPDRSGERAEEHNFTTKPAFSGWPFWVGAGVRQGGYAASYDERPEPTTATEWAAFNPVGMSTQVPVNNWQKAGYDTLPPMHVPYGSQTSGCAMGGPIVRYDGRINNPDKLPPHLDNVIISSNTTSWYAMKIDTAAATTTGAITSVFTMTKATGQPSVRNSSETVQGPDGVLYVVDQSESCCGSRDLNNTEGVAKLRYTGTCQDPGLFPPTSIQASRQLPRGAATDWWRVGATSFSLTAPGPHEATILDVAGRAVHVFRGEGHKTYNLPAQLGSGIHVLRVKTTEGVVARPLASGL